MWDRGSRGTRAKCQKGTTESSYYLRIPTWRPPRGATRESTFENARVAPACSLEGAAGVSRLGPYKDVRHKKQGASRARKLHTQKATPRDTIEGRNSCGTEGHAGHEQSAKRAPQRVVTISAFQRPPQVGMT